MYAIRSYYDQDGNGVDIERGCRSGLPGQAGHDDLIPVPDAARLQRVPGGGAGQPLRLPALQPARRERRHPGRNNFV